MRDKVARQLERFRENLRTEIRLRGYTHAEVSEKLGKNSGYVGQILRDAVRPRMEVLLEILHVLGVEPGEFFPNAFRKPDPDRHEIEPRGPSGGS